MTSTTEEPSVATPTDRIGTRLDRLPILAAHRATTALIGAGLFFDYFDSNLSGTVSQVLRLDFGVGVTPLKLLLASGFVGQFVGSVLFGRLADLLGRRRAFLANMMIYSLFTLLGAFAPGAAWLTATRFLAGVGIGAEQTLADCYLTEVLPARARGRFIAWAYTLAFSGVPAVGFAALWLAPRELFGVAGWRWVFVLGALGTVVVWLLRRGLAESPRWLAGRGRITEADALVRDLEVKAGLRPETAPAVAADVPQPVRPPGFLVLFRRRYLRRTLVMWLFCFLSVVAYYGFGTLGPQVLAAKGLDVVHGLGFTALSFLGYPVGSLIAVPIIDRLERRALVCGSAALMAVAGIGFGVSTSAVAVVLSGFSYTLLSNVFSTASHVYLAEQYPTQFRTTAAGSAYSLSRLGAAILPFALLPVLTGAGASALFGVVAAAIAVLILLVLFMGARTSDMSV